MGENKIKIEKNSFYYDAVRKLNLIQKFLFREYLNRACTLDDFRALVHFIGNQWGVLRTVREKKKQTEVVEIKQDNDNNENIFVKDEDGLFDKFTKTLFDNLNEIRRPYSEKWYESKDLYKWWEDKNSLFSYSSKICFLLNPRKYKIIYDTNNTRALQEILEKKFPEKDPQEIRKKWQQKIEDNWVSIVNELKNENEQLCSIQVDDCSVEDIFKIDCELWIKGQILNEGIK